MVAGGGEAEQAVSDDPSLELSTFGRLVSSPGSDDARSQGWLYFVCFAVRFAGERARKSGRNLMARKQTNGAKSAGTKAGPKVKTGQKGGVLIHNHNLALVRAAKGGNKPGPKVKTGQKCGALVSNHNLAVVRA
jgi:hypothetical protein